MNKELATTTQDWANVPAIPATALSQPQYLAEPQSGSILDYLGVIWRHKATIAVCSAVGLLLGVGITLPQAPVYRASTSLEIQDVKNDAAKILNPVPDAAPTDPLTDIQTQIRILQSRTLVENALAKLNINSESDLSPHAGGAVPWLSFLSAGQAEEGRDALVSKASKNLKVSESGQTRIVEVSYDATDPMLAARFANAVTTEYVEQNLQARWQMNHRTSEWLGGQLDEQRAKLRESEDGLQAYARQKGLMYTGEKQNVSEEKLRQLQMELSKAQADRVEKQSRSEIARAANLETVPEILNDGNLRAMEATLVDLRRQEADLGVTFKPDYSKTKRIRAEIEALETAVKEKRKTIANRIDNELQESERREQLLTAAYARQTRVVTDDSEKSIQYDMLKHEVDTNRQIYQTMLQRVKESTIASAMKATNVRVIDAAKPPAHPYKPNLPLNSAAGLMGGLMFGAVVVIIRSKTDGNLQEPGDAGLLLGIPELGVIPSAESKPRKTAAILPLFARDQDPETQDLQLLASSSNSPAITDSFRAVLASILFAGAKQRQRVLVLTSPSPGEGKTTTAANLAVTLAKMNRKVLLIDGDIRNPRLHDIFGLDNSTGLTNVLKRIAVNETVVESFVRETSVPMLSVLTSGPGLHAGADLLFSASMPSLIAQVRNQFDMVLIDTPPMLMMPDARVMGRFADAVILIARARQTSREALQAAFRRFVEDHTPVLGIVLNDWNAKASPYSYYSGYKNSAVAPNSVTITSAGV